MVSKTIHKAITYYTPEEPTGRVVTDAPLEGQGKAWTLGSYEHPTYPSPLNVRVGNAGIKVWMVIQWLRLCDDDYDVLVRRYGNSLTKSDVDVARWYYNLHKEWIDPRLEEEAQFA